MQVIKEEGMSPVFSWCPTIEEGALEQMKVFARLPYIKYCALMPDAHFGQKNGMPVGGVVACDNVVIPNGVGLDIGCGMGALKTNLHKSELEDKDIRKRLLHSFSRGVPVGFAHNSQKRINELSNKYGDKYDYIVSKTIEGDEYCKFDPIGGERKAFFSQLGTLGGGNHFLEVQYDEEDNVWIMIHSGSRNMGKRIGDYFNALAADLTKKWHSICQDITFLPADSIEGTAYLGWMNFALRFAYLNRKVMLEEVKRCMEHEFPKIKFVTKEMFDGVKDDMINIHHNFAVLENHFGKNYWIHRKGATMARKGTIGIIPGSMGTNSYIVQGLGNQKSMMSCSHGAGRSMGRTAFNLKMKYSHAQLEKELDHVVHSDFGTSDRGRDKGLLDVSECPGAYKDIEDVMANQKDLVKPVAKLSPMLCLKG